MRMEHKCNLTHVLRYYTFEITITSPMSLNTIRGYPDCTDIPDSKVHRANMGPTWVLSSPGGTHVGPRNLAIWDDNWHHSLGTHWSQFWPSTCSLHEQSPESGRQGIGLSGISTNTRAHSLWWDMETKIGIYPDNKVYGANMGPIWGRQDPGGSHIGPMDLAIWVAHNQSVDP